MNPKQRCFIAEYLKDKNATQAAIRAGYSKKTANQQASDLLAKPYIREQVSKALRKLEEKSEITAERILKELAHMAFLDIRRAFNADGSLKPIAELPEDIARAMSSAETFEEFVGSGQARLKVGDTKKVKFWDKARALELLGKHLKMFTEKVEHSGSVAVNWTVKVEAA